MIGRDAAAVWSVSLQPASPPRRAPALRVPSAVVGMLLFVAAEVMFFAGLVSAFVVVRAKAGPAWPPPGQPRLPVLATAVNSLFLLASGLAVAWAAGQRGARALSALRAAAVLGTVFVALQGREWAQLLAYGLTMRASPYGAFFYLIVGAHALHAVAAVCLLVLATRRLAAGTLGADAFTAVRIFWYFVVLLWPVLYGVVYLA